MRLGASSWGFYHGQDPASWATLPETVQGILAFDASLGVEIWGSKARDLPAVKGDELVGLIEACHDAEFTIVHIHGQYWSWNPTNLRREIDFSHHLSAENLVLHPVCFGLVEEDDRPDWPEIVRILEYAAKFGVRLVMENIKDSIWALDRILDEIGDDPEQTNLGICIDIGHANQSTDAGRHPVTNYLERYAGQLVHLHLHDNDGESDDHLIPGEGTVDWPSTLGVLETIGFSGTAVLEAYQENTSPYEVVRQGTEFFKRIA